jgi:outer membrane receptor for ferrienterochelin and colicins
MNNTKIILLAALCAVLTICVFSNNAVAALKSTAIVTKASKPAEGTDANLFGHVVNEKGEHLPYVTVAIKGTTIGTRTDGSGHFNIIDLPTGVYAVAVRCVGYESYEEEIEFKAGESIELKVTLVQANIYSSEVVVTADRYATERTDASVIVNTISPTKLKATQATVLSEGLNYCPGLRMENNCQNCGFNQVRMNGMEGPYSQILINSRPIFSGLAGVYGLELIPSNMIDQIEVVRGGGSALYGGNAIAGTINLILKDPVSNYYEAGATSSLVGIGVDGSGDPALDNVINVNATTVSPDKKMGMAIYGYYRDRDNFDANDDNFSELSEIENTTFGSRMFYRPGKKSKLALDFFNISETRRGGGTDFNTPLHESEIAEAVDHKITTAALTYTQFFRKRDEWNVFASAQKVDRASYYGAEQSVEDYGQTNGLTYSIGSTYNAAFDLSSIIGGFEVTGDYLEDNKLGYATPDFVNDTIIHTPDRKVTDQEKMTYGAFAQYELNWDKLKTTLGLRYDHYDIKDKAHSDKNDIENSGDVISPRISVKYDILKDLQARLSYSSGYRAPQVFDEDLHIEASGLHTIIHKNDPNLKQETSHSLMASFDYNTEVGNGYLGLLAEGFYTMLQDPFVTEYQTEGDHLVSYRFNSDEGALVAGVNVEGNYQPMKKLNFNAGFTYQISEYDKAQEDFNEKAFYRTPNTYGFITIDWGMFEDFNLSASGNFTGSMKVPYFGETDRGITNYDPEVGALLDSDSFFDMGIKASYDFWLGKNGFQIYGGVKNALNAYQDDFETGINRDPGYIYGPGAPRTLYLGFTIKS